MKPVRLGAFVVAMAAMALSLSTVPAQAAPAAHQAKPAAASAVPSGSVFTPVTPQRLLDTRASQQIGAHNGISFGWTSAQVPDNATAVVLNLTGTGSTAPTFLSLSPVGAFGAPVSNLNLAAGETRANLATVEIGQFGTPVGPEIGVEINAGPAAVDAIVDLEGYYAPGTGSGFTPLAPQRVLDTRFGTGTGGVVAPLGAGGTLNLDLSSAVPAGATAAVFNLTGADVTASTFVTAWPTDAQRPLASNLNLVPGQISPNLVTVAISADRKVSLFNAFGSLDLIADLAGYYAPGSGQSFYPLVPIRVMDTRDANGNPVSPIGQQGTRTLDLSAWLPPSATSTVFNLTGTNVTASTFVTAWPHGVQRPLASNLNLVSGQTSANLAVVTLGAGRTVDLFNLNGRVDVVADLAGYFAPALPACTTGCLSAFGVNQYGQFGDGTTVESPQKSSPVYGISDVTQVVGDENGGVHALKSDGTVWGWGFNIGGQLGTGDNGTAQGPGSIFPNYAYSPVPIQVPGLTHVVALAGNLALKSDGTVWSWGFNDMWELGDGSTDVSVIASTPVQVSGLTGVVAIASQIDNGYALKSDGTVWSWGQNIEGELGDGANGDPNVCQANEGISPVGPNCASAVPVQVVGLTNVTKLGVRIAVKSDGTVWRWGPLIAGQQDSPVQMTGLTNVTALTQNNTGTDYALLADGTVWAWGSEFSDEFGNGVTCAPGSQCSSDTPVQVSGLSSVIAIAGGDDAGYAVKSDGTVWAWGGGQHGVLGDGNEFGSSNVPVQVPGISGATGIGDFGYTLIASP